MLPALSKWADKLIIQIPKVDTDLANKIFGYDQRDFLVSQIKELQKKLQQTNGTLSKRDETDLIGTAYSSLYRSSMYSGLDSDGFLIDITPETSINDAFKMIHIAGQNHPNLVVMIGTKNVFYAKTFTTWLNNCGNWLTSWLWGIYDVLDVLQRCVSTTDYNNNNIDNAIDWDPSDSTGSITKVTAGTSITMPSLSNGVCLAGSGFDQLLIAGRKNALCPSIISTTMVELMEWHAMCSNISINAISLFIMQT
jgi:hypothetical protein